MTGPGEPICDHTPKAIAVLILGMAVDWEAICCWSLAVEFQLEGLVPSYHGRYALIFELCISLPLTGDKLQSASTDQ